MASRAELVQMCKELQIKCDGSIEEMANFVRDEANLKLNKRYRKVGNSEWSETLLKFLSQEYDYVFRNEDGNEVNYKGEIGLIN